MTLQVFLEYDDQRRVTVNAINKKKLTPLCKLASKPGAPENLAKVGELIAHGASCRPSLPEFHPFYCALEAGNYAAARVIFLKTDAIECFGDLGSGSPLYPEYAQKPLLISVLKANNNSLLDDCFKEWFKHLKSTNQSMSHLSIFQHDLENRNVFHIIAENQSIQ